jgi:uncharacterized protein (TIGR03437 family)
LAAQITLTPVRIAGFPAANWSIGDGGPATDALLSPTAFAWDRAGNLLIADSRYNRIRRLTPDGAISKVVDQVGVASMAVDSAGNLYVSVYPGRYPDQGHIFEFPVFGSTTEIPNPAVSGVPPALAIDALDNLYMTDQVANGGGFVWKRSPSGSVLKIAGSGSGGVPGASGQGGPALQVTLAGPHALAFDRSGNLLIADFAGVLRLNPDGTLIRLFGAYPQRIAVAPDGSIYYIGAQYGIWRWNQDTNGVTSSFAGTLQSHFSDGCAQSGGKRVAKYASMNPSDLTFDAAGRLYVADNFIDSSDSGRIYYYSAGRIRRIDPDGSIRTVAGTGSMPRESAPGGTALGPIFHNPEALAVDSAGNVFFAESAAGHVHEITTAGQFLTVAGTNSPPAGEDPACYPSTGTDVLSSPRGIATDAAGNLYIADTGANRILLRSLDGAISTFADTATPTAIAVKPDGGIYVLSANKVLRIGTGGAIESTQAPQGISWLAVGFDGRLILSGSYLYKESADGSFYALRSGFIGEFTVDPTGAVYGLSVAVRISPNCNVTPYGFPPGLYLVPQGLAADSAGNLYLSGDNSVFRIAAIPAPATDKPSVYLNVPGVFNAASNFIVYSTVPPPCFKQCGPYPQNDSITGNEILHITGGCMGPLMPVQASSDNGSLPTSLQGTRVLFDGEAAPLLSVQATGILAIAPHDVASKSNVTLTVENQGVTATAGLSAAAAVPGIFISSGTQAAAINEDGSLNGTDHPAPAGSIVSLYLTGAGLTDPPIDDGVLPSLPLPPLALPVTVQVGGAAADVLYAGAALGLPGMAQVNLRVPAIAASNAASVQITIGGLSRNQAVAIAVQ